MCKQVGKIETFHDTVNKIFSDIWKIIHTYPNLVSILTE